MILQISGLFELAANYRRLRTIRKSKSIADVSFDTCILDFLDCFLNVCYFCCYTTSFVHSQYQLRFPNLPMVMSWSLFSLEVLKLAVSGGILVCISQFHHTKRRYQSWSEVCKFMTAGNLVIFAMISWAIRRDRFALKFLDSVDYLWFAGQQAKVLKYWPQMMVNIVKVPKRRQFKGSEEMGYARPVLDGLGLFILLAGLVIGLIGKLVLVMSVRWYEVSINCYTFVYYIVNILTVPVLIYQVKERREIKEGRGDGLV